MNLLLKGLALLALSHTALSQDTPPLTNKPNTNPIKPSVLVQLFSAHPTVQEIGGVFDRAGAESVEPVIIVQQLISGGNAYVPVLSSIISADTIVPLPQPLDTVTVARPSTSNRVLAVYALDGIGSAEAYTALLQFGANHRDVEIRAASLNALANSYLNKAKSGIINPNKDIVHILLRLANDSSQSTSLKLTIAEIAREGLRRWFNLDMGIALRSEYRLVVDKTTRIMSSTEYWDYWWSLNNTKLVWTPSLGQFKMSE